MGIGVVGFNWRHGISAVLGYLLSSWTHNPEPVVSAIQEAGRVAEIRCLEGVKDHLSCPTVVNNHFSTEFQVTIGLTLLSVSGGLVILCWYRFSRVFSSTVTVVERDSDFSPSSADERKQLAHRQLAEIRSRRGRDGLAQ